MLRQINPSAICRSIIAIFAAVIVTLPAQGSQITFNEDIQMQTRKYQFDVLALVKGDGIKYRYYGIALYSDGEPFSLSEFPGSVPDGKIVCALDMRSKTFNDPAQSIVFSAGTWQMETAGHRYFWDLKGPENDSSVYCYVIDQYFTPDSGGDFREMTIFALYPGHTQYTLLPILPKAEYIQQAFGDKVQVN